MKLINRDTDYAIRALRYIMRSREKVVSVAELVKRLEVPRPFLRKILQVLNKKGILKSYKGRGGGFILMLAPNKIYLMDLINIFQGPFKLNECIFKKDICPDTDNCVLKQKIDRITRQVTLELKSITLESLK